MNRRIKSVASVLAVVACLACGAYGQTPLGTSFTYQGELRLSGNPATSADLEFTLWASDVGGSQIGVMQPMTLSGAQIANGRFTVVLNNNNQFTATPFGPDARWLQIAVRSPAGSGTFTTLGPRQRITVAPNAVFALEAQSAVGAQSAANAAQFGGQAPAFYTNAANMNAGTLPGARLAGTYGNDLTLTNVGNSFAGSGTGLTGLNASNLASGTVADARLSSNVPLLNAVNAFGASGNTFAGFLGIGRNTPVTGADALAVRGIAGAGGYAGMYVEGTDPASWPFYGYATNGAAQAWHYLDGGTGTWHLYNGGPWLSVTNTGHVGIGTTSPITPLHVVSETGSIIVETTTPTGSAIGVWSQIAATHGEGVVGRAIATSGPGVGVRGQSHSVDGLGVLGRTTAATGSNAGVSGVSFSTGGRGVQGEATAPTGGTYGVRGESASTSGTGVMGFASAASGIGVGVDGQSASPDGTGVQGTALAASGVTYGVRGESASTTGRGVMGLASAASGFTVGVQGQSASPDGIGVQGIAFNFSGAAKGVYGFVGSPNGHAGYFEGGRNYFEGSVGIGTVSPSSKLDIQTTGLPNISHAHFGPTGDWYIRSASSSGKVILQDTGGRVGVGTSSPSGILHVNNGASSTYAVLAEATTGTGVHGRAFDAAGYGVSGMSLAGGFAVYSFGNMGASGNKPFRIDHPDDPTNKYLLHYASEAPEPQNFYNGIVALDSSGAAWVTLPQYFAKINRDPRYTLTAVGAPMPLLHVSEKISEGALAIGAAAGPGEGAPGCSFRIAGGVPGGEVSWEVKAIRNDLWVRTRGAPIEVEKGDHERGKYQHPDLYGQPPEMGMNYRAGDPAPGRRVDPQR